jgi:predicted CopG family antitoxin
MSTTIALKDDTYSLLKMVKEELDTPTYDDTIQKLISKIKKPKKSYFGKFPTVSEFKREEIDRFA